jgi:hypothetical protein
VDPETRLNMIGMLDEIRGLGARLRARLRRGSLSGAAESKRERDQCDRANRDIRDP